MREHLIPLPRKLEALLNAKALIRLQTKVRNAAFLACSSYTVPTVSVVTFAYFSSGIRLTIPPFIANQYQHFVAGVRTPSSFATRTGCRLDSTMRTSVGATISIEAEAAGEPRYDFSSPWHFLHSVILCSSNTRSVR